MPATSAHYKITAPVRVYNSVRGDGSMPVIRNVRTNGQESKAMLSVDSYTGPGMTISGLHLDGGWNESDRYGEFAHNIMVKGTRNLTIQNNILKRAEGTTSCSAASTTRTPAGTS